MDLERIARRLGVGIGTIIALVVLSMVVGFAGLSFNLGMPSGVNDILGMVIVGLGLGYAIPYLQTWLKA